MNYHSLVYSCIHCFGARCLYMFLVKQASLRAEECQPFACGNTRPGEIASVPAACDPSLFRVTALTLSPTGLPAQACDHRLSGHLCRDPQAPRPPTWCWSRVRMPLQPHVHPHVVPFYRFIGETSPSPSESKVQNKKWVCTAAARSGWGGRVFSRVGSFTVTFEHGGGETWGGAACTSVRL